MNWSDGDSNARLDEPVRTGKSFFCRAARKKIAVPARAGSDGDSTAEGAHTSFISYELGVMS